MTRAAGMLLAALAVLGCRREQEPPPHVDTQPKAAAPAQPFTRDIGPHLAALAGSDQMVANDAEEALVELGPGVVPALLSAFPNQPPAARVRIVRALARLRTDEAVAAVVQSASNDSQLEVRAASLRALATTDDPRSLGIVMAALDDPLPAVRWAALDACVTLCTTPAAIQKVATLAVSDPDLTAGIMARTALGRLRASGHAEPVQAAIAASARPALSANTPDTRARAALLVADGGDAAGLASLATLATGVSPALQRQVAFTLGYAGDAAAIAPLKALLGQQDASVQLYAYDALRRLGDRGVSGAQEAAATYAGPKPWAPLGPPDA
jgi:HEAT repeat protein